MMMDRFFSFLIRHKVFVIVFFAVAGLAALLGIGLIDTSFDIATFMPGDSNSVIGSEIEEQEFASQTHAYILLEDRQNWQVTALIERVETTRGVESVQWLSDAANIYAPESFLPERALEKYQKGDATILIVALSQNADDASAAIKAISQMLGSGEYFGGSPVVFDELRYMIGAEMPVYLAIAGAILLLLLGLSLSSYLAPLLCLVNIGVAILLNYGTNFLVGASVSFFTVAIAAILQLAVSMDYSIFLIHRFEEDLQKSGGDVNRAMITSVRATMTAISSSALTDCAGFVALIFMRNQIGADLGVVLAKGVLISLFVSITLLPCLMMASYKIGKKRHRVLMPSLRRAAKPLTSLRYVLAGIVIIVLVPMILASARQEYYYTTEDFMPDDTAPIIATKKIGETFGATDTVNVLYPKSMAAKEGEAMAAVAALGNIREVAGLSDTVSPGVPELFVPETLREAYVGETYRRFSVTLARDLNNDTLFATVNAVRDTAAGVLGPVYVTGGYASATDMASTAEWDNVVVEFLTTAFIFVILLIAFRSLLVPVFLVLVIRAAIYINIGIGYFAGAEMVFLTPVLVGAVQLGATVDYAILFTSRYFEFRHTAINARQAVQQTIEAAARPMMTSVLTFFFATLSITIGSSLKAATEVAGVVGRGALISFGVILFALPALFVLFDKPLLATTLEFRADRRARRKKGDDHK